MRPSIFSTDMVARGEQFDAWRSWFQPTFAAVPDGQENNGFLAQTISWDLGSILLCRVKTPSVRVFRTATMIRHDYLDHWNIGIGLGGAVTGLSSEQRDFAVPSRIPFILSLGAELSSERQADERLQLYFSRDQFPHLNASLDLASRNPISTPLGMLLVDFLELLERNLHSINEDEMPRVHDALRAMLGACIRPTSVRIAEAYDLTGITLKERARTAIRRNIASARLGSALLCREVGVSRTHLYRIFENEGGVSRYILRTRLRMAFAQICEADASVSVTTIAVACGFPDVSTFSRSFKREFGMTPTEVRIASSSGSKMGLRRKAELVGESTPLVQWLKGL